MPEYTCKCCGYITRKKSNYTRHMKSKIHESNHFYGGEKNMNPVISESSTPVEFSVCGETNKKYQCKYCFKYFSYRPAMYHHIKYVCKLNNKESLEELARLMNMNTKHNTESLDTMDDKYILRINNRMKAIDKLVKKLGIVDLGGNQMNVSNVYNTMMNSNNTVHNYQQINIVNYKDSDLSNMTIKDMGIIYSKYTNCIPQCVRQVHCNEKFPEHMNMYISNLRTKYIMVYENCDWQVKDREDVFNFIINDKNGQLEEWLEQNGDQFPDMLKKFKHYIDMYNTDDGSINKKIKHYMTMDLYNVRHKILNRIDNHKNDNNMFTCNVTCNDSNQSFVSPFITY